MPQFCAFMYFNLGKSRYFNLSSYLKCSVLTAIINFVALF